VPTVNKDPPKDRYFLLPETQKDNQGICRWLADGIHDLKVTHSLRGYG